MSDTSSAVKIMDKKLFNKCERMWSEIIKLKAGYKSEISMNDVEIIDSHHFWGKSSYALRFDTRGGIALTHNEHFKKAHASDPSIRIRFFEVMKEYMMKREGKNIIEILEIQKQRTGVNLNLIAIQLEQELKELKEKINDKR